MCRRKKNFPTTNFSRRHVTHKPFRTAKSTKFWGRAALFRNRDFIGYLREFLTLLYHVCQFITLSWLFSSGRVNSIKRQFGSFGKQAKCSLVSNGVIKVTIAEQAVARLQSDWKVLRWVFTWKVLLSFVQSHTCLFFLGCCLLFFYFVSSFVLVYYIRKNDKFDCKGFVTFAILYVRQLRKIENPICKTVYRLSSLSYRSANRLCYVGITKNC